MKIAALDLGSNSFLCLICEVQNQKVVKIFEDELDIVRLGKDVDKTRKFHPESLVRARNAFMKYKKMIDHHLPERVLAMATSASRDVSNKEELFLLGKEFSIPIEVISGHQEASLTFQGALSDDRLRPLDRLIIDIGGGSTEIIKGNGSFFDFGESIDIGAVRLTEMFFEKGKKPKKENRDLLLEYVRNKFIEYKNKYAERKKKELIVEELLAVAGTATELASITILDREINKQNKINESLKGKFQKDKIDAFVLSKDLLWNWVEKFSEVEPKEIHRQFHVSEGRADVILAGTLILWSFLEAFLFHETKVSTRGLRYGVALEVAKR